MLALCKLRNKVVVIEVFYCMFNYYNLATHQKTLYKTNHK